MNRHYRTTLAISLISSATLASMTTIATAAPTQATAAASKPIINFSFVNNQLEVGQPVQVRYNTKKVPHGGSIVLQRAIGTAGVWHTLVHLKNSTATRTVTAPAVGQGITSYRLVVTDHHGKALISKTAKVTVYGTVELGTVIGANGSNTVNLGNSLFRYVDALNTNGAIFKVTGSTCRSVNLQVAVATDNSNEVDDLAPTTVTVVSEGADAVSTTAPVEAVAGLFAPISGDFELDMVSMVWGAVYVNGTADCYTATGQVAQS